MTRKKSGRLLDSLAATPYCLRESKVRSQGKIERESKKNSDSMRRFWEYNGVDGEYRNVEEEEPLNSRFF